MYLNCLGSILKNNGVVNYCLIDYVFNLLIIILISYKGLLHVFSVHEVK